MAVRRRTAAIFLRGDDDRQADKDRVRDDSSIS
jgi:hypothetical protein